MFDFNFFVKRKFYMQKTRKLLVIFTLIIGLIAVYLFISIRQEVKRINLLVYSGENLEKINELKKLEGDILALKKDQEKISSYLSQENDNSLILSLDSILRIGDEVLDVAYSGGKTTILGKTNSKTRIFKIQELLAIRNSNKEVYIDEIFKDEGYRFKIIIVGEESAYD